MLACRGRGDMGCVSEFATGPCAAVHENVEHRRSRGIPNKSRDLIGAWAIDGYGVFPLNRLSVVGRFWMVLRGLPTIEHAVIAHNSHATVPRATEAVIKARASLASSIRVTKVDAIELIRGADAADPTLASWHIRFNLAPSKKQPSQSIDLFVSTETGDVWKLP